MEMLIESFIKDEDNLISKQLGVLNLVGKVNPSFSVLEPDCIFDGLNLQNREFSPVGGLRLVRRFLRTCFDL